MAEDQYKAIEELQRQIDDLRGGTDIENIENMKRRAFPAVMEAGVVDNATSNENDDTTLDAEGGTVYHNQQYNKRVRVTIDGTDYYIGLYNV